MEPDNNCSGDLVILCHSAKGGPVRVAPRYADAVGYGADELGTQPLIDWIHPDDRPTLEQALAVGEGAVRARHRTRDGGWISLDWRVRVGADGPAALGMRRPGKGVSTASEPANLPVEGMGLARTLEAMARIVEAQNPGMMCSILLVDDKGERVTVGAGPSLPAEYNRAVEGLQIGPTVGSCGTAAFWNVPVVVENIAEDPLWKDLRSAAAAAGVQACWSHPITTIRGRVLGAMALYNTAPCAPERHHMDGLEIAARMVGLAIERDRLEERLRQGAKMEALGVLAGGIAHDFNNILAAILGNAELALETMPEGAVSRPMLETVKTASVNAADLCSQMLAYAGRGGLSLEPVECNGLLRELGGLLQVALAKKAELRYELNARELWVNADPSQLRQVIVNLITNASEAIGNNQGVIGLGTSVASYGASDLAAFPSAEPLDPGEYVQIWVSDTGGGVDAASRAKIFDPFFSTKSAGRGLGLAAVQGIIRRHSGAITLIGGGGDGTRFSVLLPRCASPGIVHSGTPEERRAGYGATILVADDEPIVLKTVAMMLESAGYAVLRAANGREAVELYTQHRDTISCALLDLSMPQLDGDEVLYELNRMGDAAPVILMSGFTEEQVLNRVKDARVAGVLQKPILMDSLLSGISRALADLHGQGPDSPLGRAS